MKTFLNLFFAFLFVSSSFAQITVKTSNSGLNLRSEPTTSSNVLFSLPNETELLYANDWAEGWIKVRYSNSYNMDRSGNDEVSDYTGWVNAAFVETKMFKSKILDPMSWQDETDGCFYGIYGVDGLLSIDSYDEQSTGSKFKVKIKGISYTLTMSEDDGKYFRFEHPQVKIEFFGAETDRGIESSESKGVLRVEHNGKVEYIYAALGGGC
ncbi:MAG: SH3 domain-containing protein [Crocinitomicaceae bacterium]|nr:SH3 domain-containing protein [Crocinitomicaceae bacterium]MCF8410591.1 SH3 domain-containing protein [Crocinitomicaceae bacterium]MCF8444160.1 SH3 domain-containing protein [Crocinitomicaceae bacterium]